MLNESCDSFSLTYKKNAATEHERYHKHSLTRFLYISANYKTLPAC